MRKSTLGAILALVATPLWAQTVAEKNISPNFSVIEQHGFTLPEDTKRQIIESGIFDTPYNGQVYNFKVERASYGDDFGREKCYVDGRHYKGQPYTYESVQIDEGVISPPFAVVKRSYRDSTCAPPGAQRYSRNAQIDHFFFITDILLAAFFTGRKWPNETYYKDFSYEKFSGTPGGFKFIFSGKYNVQVGKTAGEQSSIEVVCAAIPGVHQRIRHKKGEGISGKCQKREKTSSSVSDHVSAWDEPLLAPLLYDMDVLIEPIENFPVGRKISKKVDIPPPEWEGKGALGMQMDIFIERVR